jgi:hypothetical protein
VRAWGNRLPPLEARLPSGATLWGIGEDSSANNHSYAFFIVDKGAVTEPMFEEPPGTPLPLLQRTNVLINPAFSENGLILSESAVTRSARDSGTAAQWIWDGKRFRLLSYSRMESLWGVNAQLWPTLYQAKLKTLQ